MFTINVLDNISPKGLELFDKEHYELSPAIKNPDAILVRSYKLHDHEFSTQLKAVGRAGVGTDNIPVAKLTEMGIPVFYAPGANANAVKELVLAAMLIGYRHLDEARLFLNQVTRDDKEAMSHEIETQKKKFVGHEISGKTLGVIGLGNIGVLIANAALALGMNVLAYDPNMTLVNALALMPGVKKGNDLSSVLSNADILTLHVPLNAETTHFINEKNIHLIKEDALLLNFSREKVVDEMAVLNRLNQQKLLGYITDFPTLHLAEHPKVLSFPHLGASTVEAEENSASMVIRNIKNYLEHGIIEHSINFPDTSLSPTTLPDCHRMVVINHNVPGIIAKITKCISESGCNIERMINTSRGNIAVNLIDISGDAGSMDLIQTCAALSSVIKVNLLEPQ